MDEIKILSPAKINLFLNVGKIRHDKYHEIDTIFQRIDLYDELTIKRAENYSLKVAGNLCSNEDNLCTKAYRQMEQFLNGKSVEIRLNKKIPIGAGLGGGSSNAAMVLKGIKKLYNLDIETKKLFQIAKNLGADVPFFLTEGSQRGQGIGEKLSQITDFSDRLIYLINPKISISSGDIYGKIDFIDSKTPENLIRALKDNVYKDIAKFQFNSMEKVVFKIHPEIENIKRKLLAHNAYMSLMSGSGSTVFGIFKDDSAFDELDLYFRSRNYETYRLKTVRGEKYV